MSRLTHACEYLHVVWIRSDLLHNGKRMLTVLELVAPMLTAVQVISTVMMARSAEESYSMICQPCATVTLNIKIQEDCACIGAEYLNFSM